MEMTMSIKIARTLRMALDKRLDEIDHMILIGSSQARYRILEANHILHTLANQLYREATKSNAEREDEGAEKLIRRDPKKRERRTDLRKNRVEFEKDPDLQGLNRGDDGDPDLSRRDRKMASRFKSIEATLLRVAARMVAFDVGGQARENLKDKTYRDVDTQNDIVFQTAYNKGNPKAIQDYKQEVSRLKQKKKDMESLQNLSEEQENQLVTLLQGKDPNSLDHRDMKVFDQALKAALDSHNNGKGKPKDIKENLKGVKGVDKVVDVDALSTAKKKDVESISQKVDSQLAKEENERKKREQRVEREREENKLRNEQELKDKMSEVDPESLKALEDRIKELKDQISKETDIDKKKVLEAKLDVATARLKSLKGGAVGSETVQVLLEKVKSMDEPDLEEMRATQKPMEEEFINKAVMGDMEGLIEEVGDLSEFDPEGASPSDVGAFMARSKAKDAFIDDPLWQYPLPPQDPKNRSEHEAHVFNSSYLNFSEMEEEDRERVDASTMAKKKELELKLLEASEDEKEILSGELENLDNVRSALNTAHLMGGGGYGKTKPLDGFHEVPKDIIELAKKTDGSPSMLSMVSAISNHGKSNVDMREVSREALSGTSDDEFTEAMGGSTGPYSDLLKMLEPSFCPPSLKNTDAKEGECPEPMSDEDKQVIRDVVTTLFLDGQSLQRMQSDAKKKPIKKNDTKKQDSKKEEPQPKKVNIDEYESILFEDGPPSKEDFEEFESFVREDNLVRIQEERGLPNKIQKAVKRRGRPRKKPGDPKGKYTRRKKPQEPLVDETLNDVPTKNKGGRPRKKPGDPKGKYTRRKKPQESGKPQESDSLLKEIRKRHEALWNELERDFG
jgi:hypothetical protein